MALLNYTTSIAAAKTVAQVQDNLVRHGAKAILSEFNDNGSIKSLSFKVETPHGDLGFRLPIKPESVLAILVRQSENRQIRPAFATHEQAVKVAWRILKDWIEAQMAILETEMVTIEQVFLPYLVIGNDHTLYESMVDRHFLLTAGNEQA